MRIIAKSTLRDFWLQHPDAERPLKTWHRKMRLEQFTSLGSITRQFPRSSMVPGNRIVFRIAGNRYRLVVEFNLAYQIARIRFIGTHNEYDLIDATTI